MQEHRLGFLTLFCVSDKNMVQPAKTPFCANTTAVKETAMKHLVYMRHSYRQESETVITQAEKENEEKSRGPKWAEKTIFKASNGLKVPHIFLASSQPDPGGASSLLKCAPTVKGTICDNESRNKVTYSELTVLNCSAQLRRIWKAPRGSKTNK